MNKLQEQFVKPQFKFVGSRLLAQAPAKLNLYLLIGNKRDDGFHDIDTLMSKITYYDELLFEITSKEGIELICNGLWSPQSKDNLVYKAAELFYQYAGKKPGVSITLTKNIPAGSGLGGASSDAATTVLALNKLYNQPLTYGQMQQITAQLGSDVPFFLGPPAAICTGRGEKITELDEKISFLALLITSGINVSTKKVYGNFKVDLNTFSALKEQIKPLLLKNRVDLIQKMCANMLSLPCFSSNSGLALLKTKIEKLCKIPVSLSGSGSALFAVVENKDYHKAQLYQRQITDTLNCNCNIVLNNIW